MGSDKPHDNGYKNVAKNLKKKKIPVFAFAVDGDSNCKNTFKTIATNSAGKRTVLKVAAFLQETSRAVI